MIYALPSPKICTQGCVSVNEKKVTSLVRVSVKKFIYMAGRYLHDG
jgi:hypothetical protein